MLRRVVAAAPPVSLSSAARRRSPINQWCTSRCRAYPTGPKAQFSPSERLLWACWLGPCFLSPVYANPPLRCGGVVHQSIHCPIAIVGNPWEPCPPCFPVSRFKRIPPVPYTTSWCRDGSCCRCRLLVFLGYLALCATLVAWFHPFIVPVVTVVFSVAAVPMFTVTDMVPSLPSQLTFAFGQIWCCAQDVTPRVCFAPAASASSHLPSGVTLRVEPCRPSPSTCLWSPALPGV